MGFKKTILYCSVLLINVLAYTSGNAQRSLLINFGSSSCTGSVSPGFSIIKNPLTGTPEVLAQCDLSAQVPDFFGVFIAYNPKNNKIYVADVRSFTETKIWVLDIGLPGNITCPAAIPATPDYTYNYVSNNFEFDNNGDLWSLADYDAENGTCSLDKLDINTGAVINSRVLQFPPDRFPTRITSGDITIIPNGRMFLTLGDNPSQLYEVKNYDAASGSSVDFLQTLPKNCYGLAYLNGTLEVTGQDFAGNCYYFDYDISSGVLGTEKSSQNNQSPIDNSSFTPSVGCTKRIVGSAIINSNTADITYELYAENLGNVILNNINLQEDLGKVFGAANVSNVSVSFVPGFNLAGLKLQPAYNGTTVTSLLLPNQNLPNNTLTKNDYYFKVLVSCRVTNLSSGIIYLNSAIASADIGATGGTASLVNVSDSSINCGSGANIVDPNQNGNASDAGENTPTPYVFRTLPVHFLQIDASVVNNNAWIKWIVATPVVNAQSFEVQYSSDARSWTSLGKLTISDAQKASYQLQHSNIPFGNLYYRIKQTDNDGSFIYSSIVLLNNKPGKNNFTIYPNPAANFIAVSSPYNFNQKTFIELYDAMGIKIFMTQMLSAVASINTAAYPDGAYLLKLTYNNETITRKILIKH